jgi:hypothetical protein
VAFEIPSFFYMQSYKKRVVCARKTGYLTFAEGQYFRGLRGGDGKALLLDAEVMLLHAEVMLLPPKSIAFAFLGEKGGIGGGVFNTSDKKTLRQ